jgi:hypothetical protein
MYKGYSEQNVNMIQWVNEMSEDQLTSIKYQLSDKTKDIDMVNPEDSTRITVPLVAYCEKKLYGQQFTQCD